MSHELDAVDKREWRLLFGMRRMDDERALQWFISLHGPLFAGAFLLVAAPESWIITALELAVDTFLVVHLALHERLNAKGEVAFRSRFSRSFIWTAAAMGVLHAVMVMAG
jgi:hypothetical protein